MKNKRTIFILTMAFVATSSSDAVSVTEWSEVGANQPLANQFRFGLFNANGSTTDLGWLGYLMGNGNGGIGGQLYERINPNTGTFPSTVNSLYS